MQRLLARSLVPFRFLGENLWGNLPPIKGYGGLKFRFALVCAITNFMWS